MSCVRRAHFLFAGLAVASSACSARELPATSPNGPGVASDGSVVCNAVTDRFVGIPGLEDETRAAQAKALSGRWWIRGCSTKYVREWNRVRLEGPGWYFVDRRDTDFELRQQVTFRQAIELEGAPALTVDRGVASLRFETKIVPEVELHVAPDLRVQPTSAWGSLVSWVPLVSVRDRVAERLSALAVSALRTELGAGATATYDLSSGQSDAALGSLPAGHTPLTAFSDGIPWSSTNACSS